MIRIRVWILVCLRVIAPFFVLLVWSKKHQTVFVISSSPPLFPDRPSFMEL